MWYRHLLMSQLGSQRVYFEEIISKAAKASAATSAAAAQASESMASTASLRRIPSLEREAVRERKRATGPWS